MRAMGHTVPEAARVMVLLNICFYVHICSHFKSLVFIFIYVFSSQNRLLFHSTYLIYTAKPMPVKFIIHTVIMLTKPC